METIVTTKVVSEVKNLSFGYWDEENEEFIPIGGMNNDELKEAAKLLGCSPALLDALVMFAETICDTVISDLVSIWQRLDNAGIE